MSSQRCPAPGWPALGHRLLVLAAATVAALLCLLSSVPPCSAAARPAHHSGAWRERAERVKRSRAVLSTLRGEHRAWAQENALPSGIKDTHMAACDWCSGIPDGWHADTYAETPCSGFFKCARGRVVHVDACAEGLFFDHITASCVAFPLCSCAHSPTLSSGRLLLANPTRMRSMAYSATYWSEVNALLAFKAVNLDPNGVLANWAVPRQGSPKYDPHFVCNWNGVSCDASNHVAKLVLNNPDGASGLWGNTTVGQSIPREFGNLTHLDTLDLSNQFGPPSFLGGLLGVLPTELGKLSKLTSLNLWYNKFFGPVPDALSSLISLQYLKLNTNNFTGPIPPSLSGLRSLTYLDLAFNPWHGSLPSELGLLPLQYLHLQGSPSMQGPLPNSFSRLDLLTGLTLNSVGLTGHLPTWLGSLSSLGILDLSNNALQGPLPLSLGNMGKAALGTITLTLSTNQLNGSIPAALVSGLCAPARTDTANTLAQLSLNSNQLSGPFPTGLTSGSCKAINNIDLSYNQIEDAFPGSTFFSALDSLYVFNVRGNRLTGPVPAQLFALPNLGQIDVGQNQLRGAIPALSCDAALKYQNPYVPGAPGQGLGQVYLDSNAFEGDIGKVLTPALAKCPAETTGGSLQFNLSHNAFSGALPPTVLGLSALQQLDLTANQLQGALPNATNCSALGFLALGSNAALSGPIPASYALCTALKQLDLSNNQLTGSIPSQLRHIGNSLQILDLSGNSLSGSIPGELDYLQQLQQLNVSHNGLTGALSANLTQLPRLIALDASDNALSGSVPAQISALSLLHSLSLAHNALSSYIPNTTAPPFLAYLTLLDLSSNQLSGPIPYGFANASSNLLLNLASNNLSGEVPGGSSGYLGSNPNATLGGNKDLCGGAGYPACPAPPSSSGGSALSTGAIVGIAVGGAVVLVGIAVAVWFALRTRDEWAGGTMLVFEKLDFDLTIDDILTSTEKFSDNYKLGRGGFGTVYRATLQDGRTVAIKRLALQSTQGDREFQAEMQTLGNIRHRNLVVLVAAYIAPPPSGERLLVYNFLSGGSLDNILSKEMPKDSPYAQWEVRRRIALDVARGLKYLHHDCTPRIIHRDMKPANVLMDDQMVAHVADFGLAREVDMTKSHMSTAVFGTIGYLAPEYTQRGRLTFKSDVFAYGVLLLQLITGKLPTDEDVAERGLARWVGASATASVVDTRMEVGPYLNQILGAVKLGLLCTSRVAADRPSMAEVVHLLENLDDFAKGITTTGSGRPDV